MESSSMQNAPTTSAESRSQDLRHVQVRRPIAFSNDLFHMALLSVLLFCVVLGAADRAAAKAVPDGLAGCDYGTRDPGAAQELDQFAFLIGNYNIQTKQRLPDGSWSKTVRPAYWEGRWILGGTAIADYWYDQPPVAGSNPGRGVNVRMFRTETKQWTNMWQHSRLAEVWTLLSEVRPDGLMHMWATDPDTSDHRRMRFEVESKDRWVRIEERSRDQGTTWFEVAFIEATRAPCPWVAPPATE